MDTNKKYTKPTIHNMDDDFAFGGLEAMTKKIREEYEQTGMINGVVVPGERDEIACRQCSSCHGCR